MLGSRCAILYPSCTGKGERMNAKQYLCQVKKLDKMIDNKQIEVEQMYSLATSISVSTDSDRVQTSGIKDKVGDTVSKIVDLQNEINNMIDEFVDRKQEVIKTIEQLNDADEYDVLHKHYIQGKNWVQIADDMSYSYQGVHKIHKRALHNVQTILNGIT
jgi:DNA-directed RNA polymerase specialized sigma subunit